jgi:hypothetical protein
MEAGADVDKKAAITDSDGLGEISRRDRVGICAVRCPHTRTWSLGLPRLCSYSTVVFSRVENPIEYRFALPVLGTHVARGWVSSTIGKLVNCNW